VNLVLRAGSADQDSCRVDRGCSPEFEVHCVVPPNTEEVGAKRRWRVQRRVGRTQHARMTLSGQDKSAAAQATAHGARGRVHGRGA
jgi:hypothetical protein